MSADIRVDYSQPPPRYEIRVEFEGGRAFGSGPGFKCVEGGSDDSLAEADVQSAAWAHYKRRHNPPGMHIFDDLSSYRWRLTSARMEGPPTRTEDEARADAWEWHDPRHELALALEGEGVQLDLWPAALTLTDAEVAECKEWLPTASASTSFPNALLRLSALETPTEVPRG